MGEGLTLNVRDLHWKYEFCTACQSAPDLGKCWAMERLLCDGCCVACDLKLCVLSVWFWSAGGSELVQVPPRTGNALQEICVSVSESVAAMWWPLRRVWFKIIVVFASLFVAVSIGCKLRLRTRKGKLKDILTLHINTYVWSKDTSEEMLTLNVRGLRST